MAHMYSGGRHIGTQRHLQMLRRRRRFMAAALVAAVVGAVLAPVGTPRPAMASADNAESTSMLARKIFARASLDVGVAYFVTHPSFEPSLNGIAVTAADVPTAEPSGQPTLNRLVSHASRRDLPPRTVWRSHVSDLMNRTAGCLQAATGIQEWGCGGTSRIRLPAWEPAPHGALELWASARAVGTPIGSHALLSAAFEIGQWRPAGVHPMLAGAARQAAAQMRLRTRSAPTPCHVTALWVLAAVVAEVPSMRMIGDMQWHRPEGKVDLMSLARHAARRGCQAAEAVSAETGAAEELLVFWDQSATQQINAAAAPGATRVMTRFASGASPDGDGARQVRQPFEPGADSAPAGAEATAPYRACDGLSQVQPPEAMVLVSGIAVHRCLAASLRELLSDARSDGVVLGGWGWRSTLTQIRLRRQYCPLPTADSDRYWLQLSLMESSECSPPVARPTTSMHESGRAVDFTCGARGVSLRPGNTCYAWLSDNAHRYGLYNFVLEPWHWSTDGR